MHVARKKFVWGSLAYFSYYEVKKVFRGIPDERVTAYFEKTSWVCVNRDLMQYSVRGHGLLPMALVENHVPATSRRQVEAYLKKMGGFRNYWWKFMR